MAQVGKHHRAWFGWLHVALMLGALALPACVAPHPQPQTYQPFDGVRYTTYERYLPLARSGDPKYQNLLGFMGFFGEGAPLDRVQARLWFQMAAKQGFLPAKRNLAIMHKLGIGRPDGAIDPQLRAGTASVVNLGAMARDSAPGLRSRAERDVEQVYATFCAGCHGLNGVAAYFESPSFALGDRLEKSDTELLASIRNGIGAMPGWSGKLPDSILPDLVQLVRDLEIRYQAGIGQILRGAPRTFFLFGPMLQDDSAYRYGSAQ